MTMIPTDTSDAPAPYSDDPTNLSTTCEGGKHVAKAGPNTKSCSQCGGLVDVARTDIQSAALDDPAAQGIAATENEPAAGEPDAGYEYIGDNNRSTHSKGLIRHVEFRSIPGSDGNTLEGYAAVFGQPALIDSWEGTFREQFERGAFSKTLQERRPSLLFDHGKHPMIGMLPIGSITSLREDERGLYVKAQIADNWLTEPVRDAIRSGAIDGMSVRMNIVQDRWQPGADRVPERSIREVALIELGPTPFPAYEGTTVSLRSREAITALSDPEVRSEIARILVSGTDLSAAIADEPTDGHSFDNSRRRARALLALS